MVYGSLYTQQLDMGIFTILTYIGNISQVESIYFDLSTQNITHAFDDDPTPPLYNQFDRHQILQGINLIQEYYQYNRTGFRRVLQTGAYGKTLVDWDNDYLITYSNSYYDGVHTIYEYDTRNNRSDSWTITQDDIAQYLSDAGFLGVTQLYLMMQLSFLLVIIVRRSKK